MGILKRIYNRQVAVGENRVILALRLLPILLLVGMSVALHASNEDKFTETLELHRTTTCGNSKYLACLEVSFQGCLAELQTSITQCQAEYQSLLPAVMNSEETFIYFQSVYECSFVKHFEMAIERTGKPNLCGLEE